MTRDEILAMEAGRVLNELVVEKVFGLKRLAGEDGGARMKGIIFSGESIPAVGDDRKRMTRMVIVPQPPEGIDHIIGPEMYEPAVIKDGYIVPGKPIFGVYDARGEWGARCPYRPGEVVYVKETWADVNSENGPGFAYKADHHLKFCIDDAYPVEYERYPNCAFTMWCGDLWRGEPGHKWRSARYMPEFAARLFLLVKTVRAEKLWDSLNAKRGYPWESNPWVWVYQFERTEAV
jgi:hypothetical protein